MNKTDLTQGSLVETSPQDNCNNYWFSQNNVREVKKE